MSTDEGGDTAPMASANGERYQDSTTMTGFGKRKRSTQDDQSSVDSNDTASRDRANLHETLRNLIDLLLK